MEEVRDSDGMEDLAVAAKNILIGALDEKLKVEAEAFGTGLQMAERRNGNWILTRRSRGKQVGAESGREKRPKQESTLHKLLEVEAFNLGAEEQEIICTDKVTFYR